MVIRSTPVDSSDPKATAMENTGTRDALDPEAPVLVTPESTEIESSAERILTSFEEFLGEDAAGSDKREGASEDAGERSEIEERKTELQITPAASHSKDHSLATGFHDLDDSWLDEWDLQVHRCLDCDKPFRSPERLSLHQITLCNREKPSLPLGKLPPQAPGLLIYPDGDLEVQVGSDEENITHTFIVSSQILCSQSRAFASSLGPNSQFETAVAVRRAQLLNPPEPAVMFLDDDAGAMKLVLLALHHRYPVLPLKPEFKALVKVAEICEKYFLHTALRTFGTKWCAQWKEQLRQPGYEDWIMLAWTFGLRDEFRALTKDLIPRINHKMRAGSGIFATVELTPAIPQALTDRLLKERMRLIQPIRDRFDAIYTELQNSTGESIFTKASLRCPGPSAQQCDWLNLGFITQAATRQGLKDDPRWNLSLKDLSGVLIRLKKQYLDCGWKCPNKAMIGDVPAAKFGDPKYGAPSEGSIKTCSWAQELDAMMDRAMRDVQGLELGEFSSRNDLWKGSFF